MIMIEKKQCI